VDLEIEHEDRTYRLEEYRLCTRIWRPRLTSTLVHDEVRPCAILTARTTTRLCPGIVTGTTALHRPASLGRKSPLRGDQGGKRRLRLAPVSGLTADQGPGRGRPARERGKSWMAHALDPR